MWDVAVFPSRCSAMTAGELSECEPQHKPKREEKSKKPWTFLVLALSSKYQHVELCPSFPKLEP